MENKEYYKLDNIDDVNEEYERIDFSIINQNTTYEEFIIIIYDPEINLDDKVKLLDIMIFNYNLCDNENKIKEFVQKIMYSYIYSETSYLTKFLIKIIRESKLNISHKIELSKTLLFDRKTDDSLLFICDTILNEHHDISNIIYFDAIKTLIENDNFKEKGLDHLSLFFKNVYVDLDYRYKSIYAILAFNLEKEECRRLFLDMMYLYYKNVPYITYKILVCQYYIINERNEKMENFIKDRVEEFIEILFVYANDFELDENIRADCLDVLLRCGGEIRNRAFRLINLLGIRNNFNKISIYDNSQNVHSSSIEKSSIEMLEKLENEIKEKEYSLCNYLTILDYFEKRKETLSEDEKKTLDKSLTRISFDRAHYGKSMLSLSEICCLVFTYISNTEYKESLENRFLEELIDSSGVCSTGNAFRLINVLSGFGDYYIKISYEDQFKSKFQYKLEKKCMDIEDEDFRNDIIIDMMSNDIANKSSFLTFFIQTYPKIKDELWEEFKEDVSESNLEEYLRICISHYMNH
jgi:hypothetical protein